MNGWLGCLLLICGLTLVCRTFAVGQVEVFGWSELRGIRVDGELFPVSTRIVVAGRDWRELAQTAHWRTQQQSYSRENGAIVTGGEISGMRDVPPIHFRQVAQTLDERTARLEIELTAEKPLDLEGIYVFVAVPADLFGSGSAELLDAADPASASIPFPANPPPNHHLGFGDGRGVRFRAEHRSIEVKFDSDQKRRVVVRDDRDAERRTVTAFFPIHAGAVEAGQVIRQSITIRADGAVDRSPATITIHQPTSPRIWEGIGGNFCWGTQSKTVPFYLDHLHLAWARVNFPWNLWQADADGDPAATPLEAQHPDIRECIRIARELKRRGIPMMVSVWNAPDWSHRPREAAGASAQQFGRTIRLDPDKREAIAASITSYLEFFKREVGEEPAYFSFNEPNLGINVLQSPQAHADDIKLLGGAFERAGLKTRLLLGDANEPRAVDFVLPALHDVKAMKYVGAVSYHSWNGGTDEQLEQWGDHARRAGLPLYVAEAGHDPDAHRYRAVLDESWYALDEAELNLKCINLSQAATIMHWQLTPDYGLVHEDEHAPGGVRLTQRWFQYSQIDRFTPRGATILRADCDRAGITSAALRSEGRVVIHLTNRQAERAVTVTGLPGGATRVAAYLTDERHQQSPMAAMEVRNGEMHLTLPALSMVSIVID